MEGFSWPQTAVDQTQFDARMQLHIAVRIRHLDFINGTEQMAFTRRTRTLLGQVIKAQNNVLGGRNNRTSVRRRKQIIDGQQLQAAFDLGFQGKRHMHGHLIPVEVTALKAVQTKRVQFNGLAFDQYRICHGCKLGPASPFFSLPRFINAVGSDGRAPAADWQKLPIGPLRTRSETRQDLTTRFTLGSSFGAISLAYSLSHQTRRLKTSR